MKRIGKRRAARVKLSADERRARKDHLEWKKWGLQFDWKIYGSDYHHTATFILPSGTPFTIFDEVRQAFDSRIEAIHEQHNPRY